jgi:hypothetical protein
VARDRARQALRRELLALLLGLRSRTDVRQEQVYRRFGAVA